MMTASAALPQNEIDGDLPLGQYESKYYTVYVPADWVVTPALDGLGRETFAPPAGTPNLEDLRFEVLVMKFPASLEEYYTAITNQDPENLKKASLSREKIGTAPAFRLQYTKISDGKALQAIRMIATQDGIVYDVTLSCLKDHTAKYQKLITAMLSSFELKTGVSP